MKNKFVYMFSEGNASMREILGGKGANLCEMTKLNIPVPQGFIVSTDACNKYLKENKISETVKNQIFNALHELEKISGKQYGGLQNPLLLSIRSGARVSMPGMMDSVLNLGMNDEVLEVLAKTTNKRFALDSYRRFIQMYSDVVMHLDICNFEEILNQVKKKNNITQDIQLTEEMLEDLIVQYKQLYKNHLSEDFPQDVKVQLLNCIEAVFKSWNNKRAIDYRTFNNIPSDWGTAVNVQQMVFGNLNNNSATGVAFTRNPATGENKIYGEFLINAQGEDIVSGVRTPMPMQELKKINKQAYCQFEEICKILERNYLDMQDIEFTIENSKLYILQTRNGKRTAQAGLKIAVDMVKEQLLTQKQALMQLNANQINEVLHPTFDKTELSKKTAIAKGLPASPGSASGYIVFNSDQAKKFNSEGKKCVLIRTETSPEDIIGLTYAEGVLTTRGGMTSHAAVVARGMGKCCVSGCEQVQVNERKGYALINGKKYTSKNIISLHGDTGKIYDGEIMVSENVSNKDFETIMRWAKKYKKMGVRANADTQQDVLTALRFGAEGVGLVRTEHMFFQPERIAEMREMILSQQHRQSMEINDLEKFQQKDFYDILKVMKGYPVIIRLLDPPLHEFLPTNKKDIKAIAKKLNLPVKQIQEKIEQLKEVNSMMGLRGCRLSVVKPELTKMQVRALVKAIYMLEKETVKCNAEIMVPLTATSEEFDYVKQLILDEIGAVNTTLNCNITIKIGTMIETPRAAITSKELANKCDFYSFGTNDLTQLTYGFSRDDSNKFLPEYINMNILKINPFNSLDTLGVGELIKKAVLDSKAKNNKLEYGVCGEHGGDADSIKFCASVGMDYVSCSAYRVPVAILSCAQAQIMLEKIK